MTSQKTDKTYTHLTDSPLGDLSPASRLAKLGKHKKKIVPSSPMSSLRDEFKRTFLPLLIDIFELRQMIDNFSLQKESPEFLSLGKTAKSPKEVLEKLESLQADVEESQRWCNGLVLQIAKGIEEAKQALDIASKTETPVKTDEPLSTLPKSASSFWKRLKTKIRE